MKYYVGLYAQGIYVSNQKPPSYKWWKETVELFFSVGQEFEIRCWEGDVEGIESARNFGVEVPNEMTRERVFQGKITEQMIQQVKENYLTKKNILKWFSMFIQCPDGELFMCEHYGTEMHLVNVEKEKAEEIRGWALAHSYFHDVRLGKEELDDSENFYN